MSTESCLNLLLEVKPCNDRVGPLVVVALINESLQSAARKLPPTLRYQVRYLLSDCDLSKHVALAISKNVV